MPVKKNDIKTAASAPRKPAVKKPEYVIGMDTGGTYTDGVLMDYSSRRVISSAKTLTTHQELAAGVKKVLDGLDIAKPSQVRLVGISSTLATNSIAESKGREVGLILIGYDRGLVESYSLADKFVTRHFEYFRGGHDAQGDERAPLDVESIVAWVKRHKHKFDAIAVSSYFSPLNPSHEERAMKAIRKVCPIPVVLGSQLSSKLDSVKRAATACLNASLVAIMSEFIEAVKGALRERGVKAPLMIVKGDGSLMSYKEAVKKPVETILSGPAASAMGGIFLTGVRDALMIDVGGTTTDMAHVKDSRVTISDDGARVGDVATAVKAASIRTACLGGDSRVSFGPGGEILIGPERVVPLCRLAFLYPQVEKEILGLDKKRAITWSENDLEYWFANKEIDPDELPQDNVPQRRVVEILAKGPLSLKGLLKKASAHHPVQLNAESLFRKGLIGRAGVTPTDVMHASGDMDLWNQSVAVQAVKCLCKMHGRDAKEFPALFIERLVSEMVEESLVFLAREEGAEGLPDRMDEKWVRFLFDRSRELGGGKDSLFDVNFKCRFPVIGIGAPAWAFVGKVARGLGSQFILPPYAEVANAVGAVAGSVMAGAEAIVILKETDEKRVYQVQVDGVSRVFKKLEEAREYAEETVTELAVNDVVRAGAVNPQVQTLIEIDGALQRIRARAYGNPNLSSGAIKAHA